MGLNTLEFSLYLPLFSMTKNLSLSFYIVCFTMLVVMQTYNQIIAVKIGDIVENKCSICRGLNECSALNGVSIPDRIVGYTRDATTQLNKQGICMDMDIKAQEVMLFGPQYQFKNTSECRSMVFKYNCLAWGSKNNACNNRPKPPCRSMCVEIADKCVFMHLYRMYLDNICGRIPCQSNSPQNCEPGSNEKHKAFNRCTLHINSVFKESASSRLSKNIVWSHLFLIFYSLHIVYFS